MRRTPFLLLLPLLLGTVRPAGAQNAGTSDGAYLTTMFLVNNNYDYAFYNPARLPFLRQSDAYLQRAPLFGSTVFYYGAVNYIIGTDATVSAHWDRLGMSGIPGRSETGAPTDDYDDITSSYALSYARRVLPFLSLGATARLAQRQYFGTSGYGLGMDIGVALLPSQFRYFDNMVLDINLQNVLPPSIELDLGPVYGTYRSVRPRNLRSSLTFTGKGGRLDLGLAVNAVNLIPPADDPDAKLRFVFDYSLTFRLARTITITAGYNNETVRLGWVLGYKLLSDAAITSTFNSFVGNGTQYAFTRRFGNTRNDNYLIKLARGREGAADDILADALTLYEAGMYLEALFRFKELAFLFPAHPALDRFLFLRGECYDRLGLNGGALSSYEELLQEKPESPFAVRALLKSARLYSAAGRIGDLSAAYQRLVRSAPASDERAAAALYLGRYLRRTGADSSAVDFFDAVPPGSGYAQAARYHAAVCRLAMGDEAAAVLDLRAAAEDTLPALIPMREDAAAALGHLAYRRAAYDTALAWYARADGTAGAVQCGIAHALFQRGEYAAAADSFRSIKNGSGPADPFFHEAAFMAAQCGYLQGDYRAALEGFNAYIALAMSDSVAELADTAGTGAVLNGLDDERNVLANEVLPAFNSRIRKLPFYRPLSRQDGRELAAARDSLEHVRNRVRAMRARIRLNDARGEWLADAHEMAGKASRALIELRYRAVFDKYDRPIAELEKKLYELLPPEPEATEEGTGDPDIEILDDEPDAPADTVTEPLEPDQP